MAYDIALSHVKTYKFGEISFSNLLETYSPNWFSIIEYDSKYYVYRHSDFMKIPRKFIRKLKNGHTVFAKRSHKKVNFYKARDFKSFIKSVFESAIHEHGKKISGQWPIYTIE